MPDKSSYEMAGKSTKKNPSNPPVKQSDLRQVDIYFEQYNQAHLSPVNRIIRFISIPLLVFGLFGLLWAMPFPHLQFLGSYNGYFNWASFFIAFAVYFYSRLSPMMSYVMLIVLLAFSYGITQLQNWQNAGGPHLWLLSFILFILAITAQLIGNRMEVKKVSFKDRVLFLYISPVWLLHLVMKRFSIRY